MTDKLTTEQIQDLVDESINGLELNALEILKANLVLARRQLEQEIDDLDDRIAGFQAASEPEAEEALVEEQKPLMELLGDVIDQIDAVQGRIDDDMWIVIDGEIIDVDKVHDAHDTAPAMLDEGRREWYVAESAEDAGERARAYWANMAENDPREFTCLVGEATLCKWGLGQYAGPGSTQVTCLTDWLDLHLDAPEEQYAGYDGAQRDVDFCSAALVVELGFTPTVAYRNN